MAVALPITGPCRSTFGGVSAGTVTANGSGQISSAVLVPSGLSQTTVSVTAQDSTTGHYASNNLGFTVTGTSGTPTLTSLSQTSGPIGTSVTVYGSGFTPSGSVQITFGGVSAGTVSANGNGQISTTAVTVPSGLSATQVQVSAFDVTAQKYAGNTLSFTITGAAITPTLTTVTPSSAAAGQNVTVSGSGFTANGSVLVYFGTTNVAAQVLVADGNGNLTTRPSPCRP